MDGGVPGGQLIGGGLPGSLVRQGLRVLADGGVSITATTSAGATLLPTSSTVDESPNSGWNVTANGCSTEWLRHGFASPLTVAAVHFAAMPSRPTAHSGRVELLDPGGAVLASQAYVTTASGDWGAVLPAPVANVQAVRVQLQWTAGPIGLAELWTYGGASLPGDQCDTAVVLPVDAGAQPVDFIGARVRATSATCTATAGPYRTYSVDVQPMTAVTLTSSVTSSGVLRLVGFSGLAACQARQCTVGGATATSLSYTNSTAAPVRLYVEAAATQTTFTQPFTLTATSLPTATAGDTCASAAPISLNATYSSTTRGLAADYLFPTSGTCSAGGSGAANPDGVFAVSVPPNHRLNVTTTPSATAHVAIFPAPPASCGTPVDGGTTTGASCLADRSLTSGTAGTVSFDTYGQASSGTYYVVVDGRGTSGTPFDFTINASTVAPLPNDDCAGIISVTVPDSGVARVTANMALAHPSGQGTCSSGNNGNDVVYGYTPDGRAVRVTLTVDAGAWPVLYTRALGNCADATPASQLACTRSFGSSAELLLRGDAGPVAIWVDDDFAFQPGVAQLDFAAFTPAANDTCASPQLLTLPDGGAFTGNGVAVGSGDTRQALDDGPVCLASIGGGGDLVYAYDLANARDVFLSVQPAPGATVAPRFSVRPNASCTTTPLASCSQDGNQNELFLPAQAAGRYDVWVEAAPPGPFTVKLRADSLGSGGVAGDACGTASMTVTSSGSTLRGTTRGAANNTTVGQLTCSPSASASGIDVFFSFTGAANVPNTFVLAFDDPSRRPVLGVLDACAAPTDVGCARVSSAPGVAALTFTPTVAGTYQLAVDDEGNATGSPFWLYSRSGPPPHDTCTSPRAVPLTTAETDWVQLDSTTGASGDFQALYPAGCRAVTSGAGVDLVYVASPQASRPYVLTVTPASGLDVAVFQLDGSCAPTSCTRAVNDGASGDVERVTFPGTAGTPVYFVVEVVNGSGGFKVRLE